LVDVIYTRVFESGYYFPGIISRTIIHDKKDKIRKCLVKDALDSFSPKTGVIISGNLRYTFSLSYYFPTLPLPMVEKYTE
jgi:hypothetical protein